MPKGDKGGGLTPGQAMVLLNPKKGEEEDAPAAYRSPLRQALVDENNGHVTFVVCESDYRALKRGIEHLPLVILSACKHFGRWFGWGRGAVWTGTRILPRGSAPVRSWAPALQQANNDRGERKFPA
jgi:hypothetical protein